jgi:hypothetical protein
MGQSVLPQGLILMEIKALGGMPLWLAGALADNEIFPATFSKFGKCYTEYIAKQVDRRFSAGKIIANQGMVIGNSVNMERMVRISA